VSSSARRQSETRPKNKIQSLIYDVMSLPKPYHRNWRAIKPAPNSGYSGWAYIIDKDYAKSPTHYVRAYNIIQSDLQRIFEFVEPSQETLHTFSYRIHELLMRTCIEVEANFKAILTENKYSPQYDRFGTPIFNMTVYKKVDITHHLSSYEVSLPIWNGPARTIKPFEEWKAGRGLGWYQAYNSSKHDRHEAFKKANMEHLLTAVAGLLVLLSSQFGTQEFSADDASLSLSSGYEYHDMEAAIGSLFRINFPNDWPEAEMYDFDWSQLKTQTDRFAKFDYDRV
jgi:hypothetical protein